jgi:hypothetical protein
MTYLVASNLHDSERIGQSNEILKFEAHLLLLEAGSVDRGGKTLQDGYCFGVGSWSRVRACSAVETGVLESSGPFRGQ